MAIEKPSLYKRWQQSTTEERQTQRLVLLAYAAVDLVIVGLVAAIAFLAAPGDLRVFLLLGTGSLLFLLAILIPRNGIILTLIDDFLEKVSVPNGRQFAPIYIGLFLAIAVLGYWPW